jgi:hypothetical protein
LLFSWTIAKYFYKDAVNNYNQFILHFTIYKQTWYQRALEKAIESAKKFIKIYSLNIKN